MPIANAARAFLPEENDGQPPLPARRAKMSFQVRQEETEVWTDGSCNNNGSSSAVAGSGIWFGEGDRRNIATRVPGATQSNQAGEIYAIAVAAAKVPPFAPLHIVSDSKYAINGLTKHLQKWEDQGWIGVANKDLIQDAAARLRSRSATTTLRWIKGHSGDSGNEGADALAKEGATANGTLIAIPPAPRKFLVPGIKLSAMTQKLAYRAIISEKGKQDRRSTERMTGHVLASLEDSFGTKATIGSLWMALRKRDVARKARDFLWKALHDALRVGKYWDNIPTMSERAVCGVCHCEESVEHILVHCNAGPTKLIWGLVEALMRRKGVKMPRPSLGIALTAPVLTLLDYMEKPPKGAERLARIAIVESIHLIWKLRCERVIGGQGREDLMHSHAEIRNRWYRAINQRLTIDQAITSRKYGKKAQDRAKVIGTWQGVLMNEEDLPEDWIGKAGVLVGKLVTEHGPGIG